MTVKTMAAQGLILPDGISRLHVRGLRASIFASIILLSPMAPERAPTIARVIHHICSNEGNPDAASTAAMNANGKANTECAILIMFRYKVIFCKITAISNYDTTRQPALKYYFSLGSILFAIVYCYIVKKRVGEIACFTRHGLWTCQASEEKWLLFAGRGGEE